jgi:FkbM family methyltransferase
MKPARAIILGLMATSRKYATALAVLSLAAAALGVGSALAWWSGASCRCAPSKFEGGSFHSEYYEDYVLSTALEGLESGTYIDVGANDPIDKNVTALFYERGWHGITIEPNPDFIPQFAKLRPRDVHLNLGIAREGGTMTFYKVTDPPGGDGTYAAAALSTFDADVAAGWRRKGLAVHALEVPVTTLNRVLEQRPLGEITVLSIDVEGFERQVLESIDLRRHRPQVVVLEACQPGTEIPSHAAWEDILLQAGYAPAMSDGLNRYYVPRDRTDLLSRFIAVEACVKRSKLARGVRLDGWMPLP